MSQGWIEADPDDRAWSTILWRRSHWWRMMGDRVWRKPKHKPDTPEIGPLDVILWDASDHWEKTRLEFFNRYV